MKTYKIKYTYNAEKDLEKIYHYFVNELNAQEIGIGKIELILKTIDKLTTFPNMHPLIQRQPWQSLGARQFEIIGYNVIYEVDETNLTVFIDRIVHINYVASHIEKDLDAPFRMGPLRF